MPNSHTAPLCAVPAHSRRGRSARRGSSKAGRRSVVCAARISGSPAGPPAAPPSRPPSSRAIGSITLLPLPVHLTARQPVMPPAGRPCKTHHSPARTAAASVPALPRQNCRADTAAPARRRHTGHRPHRRPAADAVCVSKNAPSRQQHHTRLPRRSQRQPAALPSQPDFLPQLCLCFGLSQIFSTHNKTPPCTVNTMQGGV